MRQSESVAAQTAESLTPAEPERTSWKLNARREKPSAGGSNRVGNTPEEPQTEHRGKDGRASVSAGSMRAPARRRSPEPLARTLPPAGRSASIWRSYDA